MDLADPREDQKAKFRAGHHLRHGAGCEPRLEAAAKKSKNNPICRRHCETIHNGNNIISVHKRIHQTQKRIKKPNSKSKNNLIFRLESARSDSNQQGSSLASIGFELHVFLRCMLATIWRRTDALCGLLCFQ